MWHPFVCGVEVSRASQGFRLGFLLFFGAAFSHPALCMVCDCGASCWGFFCGCFCGGCAAWTAAGSLRLLYNPSGCVCLFCAGGMGWAAAFSFAFSVPRLRRLALQCSLGASPCEVAFRGGLLALVVSGYAKEVVTSLCLGVLWCLVTRVATNFASRSAFNSAPEQIPN